jgi:Hemerythrin HHE cation binding domain
MGSHQHSEGTSSGTPGREWALTTLVQLHEQIRAEHRVLARHLDRAQEAVAALPGDAATRSCAGRILDDLATHLVAHLDDEERRLAPALTALSRVVPEHAVPPSTARYLHGFSPR